MNNMLLKVIHTYFIVITIFLFGNNTSMAESRPYLPKNITSWPKIDSLYNSVNTMHKTNSVHNEVKWVDYGSPHFSNPGLNINYKQTQKITHNIFKGFQDIDRNDIGNDLPRELRNSENTNSEAIAYLPDLKAPYMKNINHLAFIDKKINMFDDNDTQETLYYFNPFINLDS